MHNLEVIKLGKNKVDLDSCSIKISFKEGFEET